MDEFQRYVPKRCFLVVLIEHVHGTSVVICRHINLKRICTLGKRDTVGALLLFL